MAPGEPVPKELEAILGLWWTEGEQIVLSVRGGRFQADLVQGPPGRKVSCSSPKARTGGGSSRGRERGELLRAVRDESGTVTKLYFVTYPLTREPSTFA